MTSKFSDLLKQAFPETSVHPLKERPIWPKFPPVEVADTITMREAMAFRSAAESVFMPHYAEHGPDDPETRRLSAIVFHAECAVAVIAERDGW